MFRLWSIPDAPSLRMAAAYASPVLSPKLRSTTLCCTTTNGRLMFASCMLVPRRLCPGDRGRDDGLSYIKLGTWQSHRYWCLGIVLHFWFGPHKLLVAPALAGTRPAVAARSPECSCCQRERSVIVLPYTPKRRNTMRHLKSRQG